MTDMKKGKCTDCLWWIKDDDDPKRCSCQKFKNYITQNALRHLACRHFQQVSVHDCFSKDGSIVHKNFIRWRQYMKEKSEECLANSVKLAKSMDNMQQRIQRMKEEYY